MPGGTLKRRAPWMARAFMPALHDLRLSFSSSANQRTGDCCRSTWTNNAASAPGRGGAARVALATRRRG